MSIAKGNETLKIVMEIFIVLLINDTKQILVTNISLIILNKEIRL